MSPGAAPCLRAAPSPRCPAARRRTRAWPRCGTRATHGDSRFAGRGWASSQPLRSSYANGCCRGFGTRKFLPAFDAVEIVNGHGVADDVDGIDLLEQIVMVDR